VKFSFSSERGFRRCQRQYYFRDIAAWHNAKDPIRREAFVLKQLKTIELWRGLVVHRGIEKFVIPSLESNLTVDWNSVADQTVEMARRQLAFSAARKYRQKGLSKTSAADDYCALAIHEAGGEVSNDEFAVVENTLRTAFSNLAGMTDFWLGMRGVRRFFSEPPVFADYEGVKIEGHIDLMFFRGSGRPTIIDWKLYEGIGGSDAAFQTAMYAWLLCRMPNWHVSNPADVELLEVRLLDSQVIRHRCDTETLDTLEDKIYRGIHDIQALTGGLGFGEVSIGDFAYANSPGTCALCPFRTMCLGQGVSNAGLLAQLV
jgi:hypothetical protein